MKYDEDLLTNFSDIITLESSESDENDDQAHRLHLQDDEQKDTRSELPTLKKIDLEFYHKKQKRKAQKGHLKKKHDSTFLEELKITPLEECKTEENKLKAEREMKYQGLLDKYNELKLTPEFENDDVMEDLPAENEEDNHEYKFTLAYVTDRKLTKKITQMWRRLRQGNGLAFYSIGVLDNGKAHGIPSADMLDTFRVLLEMSESLSATLSLEYIKKGHHGEIAKLSVRHPHCQL